MASKSSKSLLNLTMNRVPIQALNCTTFGTTRVMASDKSHPLHIKTHRKLAAFDPQGFYWRVNCNVDMSKKAIVRNSCKKNFKKAFVWALAEAGWGPDGRPLDPEKQERRLTGAVLLSIVTDPKLVLTAKREDLRREAGEAVRKILSMNEQPVTQRRPRRSEQHSRAGSGQAIVRPAQIAQPIGGRT